MLPVDLPILMLLRRRMRLSVFPNLTVKEVRFIIKIKKIVIAIMASFDFLMSDNLLSHLWDDPIYKEWYGE
jgi:hypothetical protein